MRNRFIAASLCALGIAAIGAGSASAGVPEPHSGVVPDLTRPTYIEPRYTEAVEFFNADGLFRVVKCPDSSAPLVCTSVDARWDVIGGQRKTDEIGAWRAFGADNLTITGGFLNSASIDFVFGIDRASGPGAEGQPLPTLRSDGTAAAAAKKGRQHKKAKHHKKAAKKHTKSGR